MLKRLILPREPAGAAAAAAREGYPFEICGALVGRLVNNLREGPGEGRALQALAFEAMMALTLALPWWVSRHGVIAGPTVTV